MVEIIEGILGLIFLLIVGAILGISIYKRFEKKDKEKDHD